MYDFETLDTGEILFLAADVAGMGLPAGMGMAWLAGTVRPMLEEMDTDLTTFMSALNRRVFRWASRLNRFVTLIAVALDPAAHNVRSISAGFPSALIRRHDGSVEDLCPVHERGLALGVLEEFQYTQSTRHLRPGDAVLICSDGITGAVNGGKQVYGTSRLGGALARAEPEARKLADGVWESVTGFTGDLGPQDDVVIVCFARQAKGA
jgi:sigma-B regulation protein RsbU (phosphoserine phosphatase)